ncbi:MAG: SDR family oxidoreductase [Candidatus Hydrogenedentes bacterium]|nr:SDR family oxidoreductase [Candidatus Hydrogenedentota bacterium]
MDFASKTVVVTGGAQGIGMAVTTAFVKAGAQVVFADTDREAGQELATMLSGENPRPRFVEADVADEQSVANLMRAASEVNGNIDVLVNNAGIYGGGGILTGSVDLWDRTIAVNLRGPYLCARYAVPHMPRGGAIINICSTRAFMSEPDTEPYSASKGGLAALTHALAVSLGSRGLRVNAVSPGWIDVTGWKKTSARKQAALSQKDHQQHPAGRVGKPEDIAEACLFLADEKRSGFMTGQNMVVDGGMTKKMIYEE